RGRCRMTAFGTPPYRSTQADHAEIAQVLPSFIRRLPGYVAELEKTVATEDWPALRMIAHQLQGSGKSYGFEPITLLATDIGHLLKENALDQVPPTVSQLVAYMKSVEGYSPPTNGN